MFESVLITDLQCTDIHCYCIIILNSPQQVIRNTPGRPLQKKYEQVKVKDPAKVQISESVRSRVAQGVQYFTDLQCTDIHCYCIIILNSPQQVIRNTPGSIGKIR